MAQMFHAFVISFPVYYAALIDLHWSYEKISPVHSHLFVH